jgi:hypothetical protein
MVVESATGLLKAEKDKGHGLKALITAAGGSVAAALSKDFCGHGGIALGNEHKVLLMCFSCSTLCTVCGTVSVSAAASGMNPIIRESSSVTAYAYNGRRRTKSGGPSQRRRLHVARRSSAEASWSPPLCGRSLTGVLTSSVCCDVHACQLL